MKINLDNYRRIYAPMIKRHVDRLGQDKISEAINLVLFGNPVPLPILWSLAAELFGLTDEIKRNLQRQMQYYPQFRNIENCRVNLS